MYDTKKKNMVLLFNNYISIIKVNEYEINAELEHASADELIALCQEGIDKYDEFFELDGDNSKVNRWLGYVQGVLITAGVLTVKAERDFTRPFLTEHRLMMSNRDLAKKWIAEADNNIEDRSKWDVTLWDTSDIKVPDDSTSSETTGSHRKPTPNSFKATKWFSNGLDLTTLISRDELIEVGLESGLKLKPQDDGTMSFHEYIFTFSYAILNRVFSKSSFKTKTVYPPKTNEVKMFGNMKTITGHDEQGDITVTPKDCSLVLVKQGDKFLGVSRKNDHADMGLPGGKLEKGESFQDCALRETFEETGYKIRLLNVAPFEGTDHGLYCRTFLAEIVHPHASETSESETGLVGWFDKQDFIDGTFGEYNTNMFKHFGY